MSLLMMIGASPSSVGGGIRTTTLAVMMLTLRSFATGKKHVHVFGRRIHEEDQQKSFVVLSIFTGLLFLAILLIMTFEQNTSVTLLQVLVETASAFGTCGLSLGITSELSLPSQVVLMVLMVIGRVGIIAVLFSFRGDRRGEHYQYSTERILIG